MVYLQERNGLFYICEREKGKHKYLASLGRIPPEIAKKELEKWRIITYKKYEVIVIDPPWKYDNKRPTDPTHRGDVPYHDMDIEEIKKLPISIFADDNCILWLWTTNAFMHDAFHVLESWGFSDKTILTWRKNKMGLGAWLRGKTEHCILAIKGKPYVNLTNQTTDLEGKVREHSRKPEEFYKVVESLCIGSKLDIFGREQREGWDVIGNECDLFNK